MARAIMLLLLISPLSFAGDNNLTIITKGTGTTITTNQIGSSNTSTILCGANSGGSVPGSNYVSHTCNSGTIVNNIDGVNNESRIYTI